MDKIKALRFFVTTGETLSFVDAARMCGTSPSTISKAVSRLEKELGVSLFNRTTRIIRLSLSGEKYLATAKRILQELDACEKTLFSQANDLSGTLRINVPVSYGRLYVQPLLKHFHVAHPKLSIELFYDDAYVDIVERGIDITIRTGTLTDSGLVARKLSPIDFVTCAPNNYLSSKKYIDDPEELLDFPWVSFRYKQTGRTMPITLTKNGHTDEYHPKQRIIVDSGEALAELCADGLGLSQMPHFIARRWLYNGSMQALLPPYCPDNFGVFALYRKHQQTPAKVTLFIDYLQKWLASIDEQPHSTWARTLIG